MKEALARAVQAKSPTVTPGGYTLYQAVFGWTPMFPESLTQEGEVQKNAEQRAATKIALLRQDCQNKLKRASKMSGSVHK